MAFTTIIIGIAAVLLIVLILINITKPITKDDININTLNLNMCQFCRTNDFYMLINPEYIGNKQGWKIYLTKGKLYKVLD